MLAEWIWKIECKLTFARIAKNAYNKTSSAIIRDCVMLAKLHNTYQVLYNKALMRTIRNYGGDYVKILEKEYLLAQKKYIEIKNQEGKVVSIANKTVTILKWIILIPFMPLGIIMFIPALIGIILTFLGMLLRGELFKK